MKNSGFVKSTIKKYIEIDGKHWEYQIERKATKIMKFKVFPDLSIKVIVPKAMPLMEIYERVENRKDWFRKVLEHNSKIERKKEIEYKSGSFVHFLGKPFELKITESHENKIRMARKSFVITVTEMDDKLIISLINKLYCYYAVPYFHRLFIKCYKKFEKYGLKKPSLHFRAMKSRWGSCIPRKNKVTINLKLIMYPARCIEFVIMHELCHLKFANHSKQYYAFLTEVMPDWKIRKKILEGMKI